MIFLIMGTILLNILEINNKIFSVVVVQYFRKWIPNITVSQKVTVLFFSELHAKSEIIYFWWFSVLFSLWTI